MLLEAVERGAAGRAAEPANSYTVNGLTVHLLKESGANFLVENHLPAYFRILSGSTFIR